MLSSISNQHHQQSSQAQQQQQQQQHYSQSMGAGGGPYGYNTTPTYAHAHAQLQQQQQQQQQQHPASSSYAYSSHTLPAQHPHSHSQAGGGVIGTSQPSYSVPTPAQAPTVQEIAVHEPDLNKRPTRSAMKGAKSKEMFQKQLEQTLNTRNSLSLQRPPSGAAGDGMWAGGAAGDGMWAGTAAGDTPKARPRVAPKPTSMRAHDNKENLRPTSESSDDEEIHWRDDADSECSCRRCSLPQICGGGSRCGLVLYN